MPVGRPKKIKTSKEFDKLVDNYIDHCRDSKEPITWTGLALFLGFYGRQELMNYEGYKGFSDSVKRAKTLVENAYEKRLHDNNPTGAIFALKNMGWADKQEMDLSSKDGSMTPQQIDASKLSDKALQELMDARNGNKNK